MTLNNKTKDNIIKESVKLVQKNGYTSTSIQEIIKKSKAPQGSMYYYFPKGKDEIIIAAIDKIDAEFHKKFKKGLDTDCTNLEDVLRLIVNLFKKKEKVYGTPSFRMTLLALETIGQAKDVAKKCAKVLESWKHDLAKAIEKTGLNKDTSVEVSKWFFTTIQGAICASVIEDNTSYMLATDRAIDLITSLNEDQIKIVFKKE